MISLDRNDEALIAEFERGLELSPARVEAMLEAVGAELTNWLRSLTGEMRPPPGARLVVSSAGSVYTYVPPKGRAEGPRQAHPGGWADVTGQLALGYKHEVLRETSSLWALALFNVTEYAEALEAREGYFVLSGIFTTGMGERVLLKHAERLLENLGRRRSQSGARRGAA
ncbi:MAG: hypothetical protein R3247_06660 [Rhodothermales bacterium]|nr:hypothetical protein [Rhodothermales bacterium]